MATTQSVFLADCFYIVNVLGLPFASPVAIYRYKQTMYINQ